jgi:hypothetical protein
MKNARSSEHQVTAPNLPVKQSGGAGKAGTQMLGPNNVI